MRKILVVVLAAVLALAASAQAVRVYGPDGIEQGGSSPGFSLPDQAGHVGEALLTDGLEPYWGSKTWFPMGLLASKPVQFGIAENWNATIIETSRGNDSELGTVTSTVTKYDTGKMSYSNYVETPGSTSNALYWTGGNTSVSIPSDGSAYNILENDGTVEFWVYVGPSPGYYPYLASHVSAANNGWAIGTADTSGGDWKITLNLGTGSTVNTYTSSTRVLTGSAWHHIAFTYNGFFDAAKLYVDGVLIIDQTQASVSDPNASILLGKHPVFAQEMNNGWRMDDFRLYSTDLNTTLIQAHYNSGAGQACTSSEFAIVECWSLNSTSGTAVYAQFGHNDGTISGTNYSWGTGLVPQPGSEAMQEFLVNESGSSPGETSRTTIGSTGGTVVLRGTVSNSAVPRIYTGTSAPGTAPTKVGDIYIDTAAGTVYVSKGTASPADWSQVN
jgi:hypothetical protein